MEAKAVGLLLPLHITPCIGLYGESNVLYLIRMDFGVRVYGSADIACAHLCML